MPRQARKMSESGFYHVMIRGNNKEYIFESPQDKGKFMKIFKEKIELNDVAVAAYCLMGNHFHLVAKAEIDELADFMKKITVSYASYYNLNRDRVGHVFQGRFRSETIESNQYLLGVVRYVHRNPLEAGLVGRIEDWQWSSYTEYIAKSRLLDNQVKELVESLFGSKKGFKEIHKDWDNNEYMDIPEVMKKRRKIRANGIYQEMLNREGLAKEDLKNADKHIVYGIASKLTKIYGFTRKETSEIMGVGRGFVEWAVKK
ncbi:MAG TPA: transposase [Clostridia bacterium]|nr:transposase [Clostridia bacterium]